LLSLSLIPLIGIGAALFEHALHASGSVEACLPSQPPSLPVPLAVVLAASVPFLFLLIFIPIVIN
jgi:hypothetical protein